MRPCSPCFPWLRTALSPAFAGRSGLCEGPAMSDERMHPVGGDPAWSESYYFNFVDAESGLGMFTRMGFRPRNGWADALHVVYLGGERVAFTYGRRDIGMDLAAYDGDLAV